MHSAISATPCKTFLIIQLARFGDLLQTKRLVLSLCLQGAVHLLVDHSLTNLARLVFPQVTVHGIAAHGRHREDIFVRVHEDVHALADLDFDQVYNLNFSGLNFALSSMFFPERVRGYWLNQGQRMMDFWPKQVMRWTRNRVLAGLNLIDVWGLYADEPVAPDRVNPLATPRGKGLGVVMAGQHARRSLPPPVLAPLVHAAWQRAGRGPICLLGTDLERRAATELLSVLPASMRGLVRDLTGRTTWQELLEAVSSLDLLLTPDTGTMHLAAHLGVPVLAVFLSSAWCHETGPYGAGHLVVQASPDCAPCLESAACPTSVHCRRFFSDPAVLRLVSGQLVDTVAGGMLLTSTFDDLGLTWTARAGTDSQAGARRAFRSLVLAVRGMPGYGAGSGRTVPDLSWMLEKDWMLPRQSRGAGVCDD